MSSRKQTTRSNTSSKTRRSTSNTTKTERTVFDPSKYENRVYQRRHQLKRFGMRIRRGDTRHGDYSNVVVWKGKSRRFEMSLAEARAFKAFLDRELEVRAR